MRDKKIKSTNRDERKKFMQTFSDNESEVYLLATLVTDQMTISHQETKFNQAFINT